MDLSNYDPNGVGNPNNNIFGLPTTEEDARLIILPIPWEVTVSYGNGTARAPDDILRASLQVDLFDPDMNEEWKEGFYMRPADQHILLKSDYLRREAELYIDYISKGEIVADNQFMCRTVKDINEGSEFLNQWVYDQTMALLQKDKWVGLLGGDHSTPLGFMKALAEKHGEFGILQIDAHCDLRKAYEGLTYSHASIMYNALNEIPNVKKLVQVGIRDFGSDEWDYIHENSSRIQTYFDKKIKQKLYNGETWQSQVAGIVSHLPEKVYISFDIDGLDPKLCPNTGTPVPGGLELEQIHFLFDQTIAAGKKIIGFDLNEVGIDVNADWDANVGARALYKLCNILVKSNRSASK